MRGGWAARRLALRLLRFVGTLRSRAPDQLLIAPQDIRTADPTIAEDIYSGYYALAGKVVNAHGRSPFEMESPSVAWSCALAGFGWLRHLRAADTALARANARALVEDWIQGAGVPDAGPGWIPAVAARRLLSWLSQSPLILEGADRAFYRRFMRAIGRHAAYLQGALSEGAEAQQRLLIAIALTELGLCASDLASLQRRAARILDQEIGRQILPDGGHVGRNPQTLIDLLLDLLPLRQAFAARGVDPPQKLLNAIDRMTPMMRMFRHSNGEIALFNGMGVTRLDTIATILAHDDVRAKPILNAPVSGYQRLEGADSVLVIDTGTSPRAQFSTNAHAGVLSFEFSTGDNALVVNCGAPETSRVDLRQAARATAAHSTLVVDDVSSCRFAGDVVLERLFRGEIISGPSRVEVQRTDDALGTSLETSHDGYRRRFGLLHRRRIFLRRDGGMLAGDDRLESLDEGTQARKLEYVVRFHLHPSTVAMAGEGLERIDLRLADGQVWSFWADRAPISLEESIYFAGPDGPRPSRQIVLRQYFPECGQLAWSFERVESRTPQ